jgi:succinate dehydrogenase/fumarate reductase iron-sulfur protein
MTAYILPIDEPDSLYTIEILRYDPDNDVAPYWQPYEVPFVETMTVVEALEYLRDQGHYIAFRANCREFTCGSCAMIINGKPRLACDTVLQDRMRIEPLTRFSVTKDLVVRTLPVIDRWRTLQLWPHQRDGSYEVSHATLAEYQRVYSRCIECYACQDACPASDTEASEFIGPMWMLQIARADAHPLDGVDRIRQAEDNGLWLCVSCYECADVCPVNLSPVTEIHKLRQRAIKRRIRRAFSGLLGRFIPRSA